jgi:putative RecB family exonuclease
MSAQLEMPGMPRRLFPATPSKLAAFADCPRRYRYAYVDRPTPPKGPAWAHNTVGAAVHAALRSWWDLPVDKRTTAAARQLLYAAWSQNGFRDAEQAERWRARAAGWLTDYVVTLDPTDEPVGNERTVGATTERLALSGRVDRIDQRGDELVIVDYKTGRSVCTDDEARGSPALAAYVLGARRTLRRPCSRVELHHLPSGTVASFEHTERSLANHVRRGGHRHRHHRGDGGDGSGGGPGRRLPGGPGQAVQLVRLPAQLRDRSGRRPGPRGVELPP